MKSFCTIKGGTLFTSPCSVAITKDGHILITDDEHQLQKLTTDGVCVKVSWYQWEWEWSIADLQFNNAMGITVHPTTWQIFIADSKDKSYSNIQ